MYFMLALCSNPCIVKSTKVHLYWCMRSCDGTAERTFSSKNMLHILANTFTWVNCHQDSPCHSPQYECKKVKLTDPKAIDAYSKTLKKTLIYCFSAPL